MGIPRESASAQIGITAPPFLGQGGVPILRDGAVIGGCGVGGGAGQQDEDCAQAGVESV